MKKILLVILALSLNSSAYSEVIKLKTGATIEGKIVERTNELIKVELYGTLFIYYLPDIESIDGRLIYLVNQPVSSAYTSSGQKDPQEIFADISSAIVYITTQTIAGESFLGSGFFIDSSGIGVTNYHVIQAAKKIDVKLKDGTTYPVTGIIYYDASRDLCIFKIQAQGLAVIPLADSNQVRVGERIYVVGNPLGLEYSFSDGLISGIREFNNLKYLQFTAPISQGNSGGPIVNSQGEAVGIATFIMVGGQNLNFALAINEIKDFISTQPKMSLQEFADNVSPADYYFVQGNKSYFAGDYQQTISYYEKALQIDPNYADAYNSLGFIYAKLGQYQQARENYLKAKELFTSMGNYQAMQAIEERLKSLP